MQRKDKLMTDEWIIIEEKLKLEKGVDNIFLTMQPTEQLESVMIYG